MTNNSSIVVVHWEEQGVALGNKHIWEASFITTVIDSKDSVFFKCKYVLYIYFHLASVIKVLRHPLGVILFMALDDRKTMRPKVRERNLSLSWILLISPLPLTYFLLEFQKMVTYEGYFTPIERIVGQGRQ